MKDEDVERQTSNVNPCPGVLQPITCDPQPATPKSVAVFLVGIAALISLWLPPLPASLQFPQTWLDALGAIRLFKPGDLKPLRWDYFVVPLLAVYALWITWKSRPGNNYPGKGDPSLAESPVPGGFLHESGLTGANFLGAIKFLALPTLLGAFLLLGIGACCHSIDITPRFWKRFLLNSAIFQQMVIQLFFHRQLTPWFGAGRKTAWVLTLYFAALHAPNPGLMLGTFIGMYFWARCYQRQPNLYALAISQALLSALLMHTMPKWMLPSVSVGLRFVEKVGWLCL